MTADVVRQIALLTGLIAGALVIIKGCLWVRGKLPAVRTKLDAVVDDYSDEETEEYSLQMTASPEVRTALSQIMAVAYDYELNEDDRNEFIEHLVDGKSVAEALVIVAYGGRP